VISSARPRLLSIRYRFRAAEVHHKRVNAITP
jgi:hypothetical protein